MVMGFMNAALGARLAAGAFLAGAAFFAGAVFAVAMMFCPSKIKKFASQKCAFTLVPWMLIEKFCHSKVGSLNF
jgi:hypothetical protein